MITALAGQWLMHVAVLLGQAVLTAGVILAAVRIAPRLSPHWRYAATLLVLLKYLIPPMLPFPAGLFSLATPPAESPMAWRLAALARRPGWSEAIVALGVVHLAGIVVCLARMAILRRRLHAIASRAVAAPHLGPGVRISNEVPVAMTFGIRRPQILIPLGYAAAMRTDELDAVIAHERQHVIRGDARSILMESLVVALWWFDPLLRLVIRERRRLREECCDDEVIAGGSAPLASYARAMCTAAEGLSRRIPAFAAAAADGTGIRPRLTRMAAPWFSPQRRISFAQAAGIVLLALLLLPGVRINRRNLIAFDQATRHSLGLHH